MRIDRTTRRFSRPASRRRAAARGTRPLRVLLASIVLAGLLVPAAASAITCDAGAGETALDVTLSGNARWELCWAVLPEEGVVFRDVHYTPPGYAARRVLKQAGIGQLHIVYDDDRARRHLVTEEGLGGGALVDLEAGQCPGGVLLQSGGIDVLCQSEQGRGYVYKYYTQERQGYWLQLLSIARTQGESFLVRWRFYDDGTIEPAIGSTGTLSEFGTDPAFGSPIASTGQIGVGWVASTYWRLDFDIGSDANDDLVERFEVTRTGSDFETKALSIAALTSETSESVDPLAKRSWRVRDLGTTNADGHPVSYHLEPLQAGHRYVPRADESWADHDFAVTAYHACERFASQNPTGGGCGANLSDYLATPESVNGADVVLWYRTSYHYAPRDEDAPYRPVRWQGFVIVPRDWTDQNPLASLLERLFGGERS